MKYGQAAIEDIDTRGGRGIDRREVMSLALGDWVSAGHSVLVTGPIGAGKSWLACALAQYACRRGYSAIYQRVPRSQEELRIRHGSGAFGKWLLQLAKTDVLILDDWDMGSIDGMTRSDLLEIIDDRAGSRATIITSQLPVEHWHAWIGHTTIADAILDRVMQRNHSLTLAGDSLRADRPKTRLVADPANLILRQRLAFESLHGDMPGGRFSVILRAFLNSLVARVAEPCRLVAVQPGAALRNVGNITRSADDTVHQTEGADVGLHPKVPSLPFFDWCIVGVQPIHFPFECRHLQSAATDGQSTTPGIDLARSCGAMAQRRTGNSDVRRAIESDA